MTKAFFSSANTSKMIRSLIDMALPLAIVLLAIFFYIRSPVFFSYSNIFAITVQVSAMMVIAVPCAILMMAGKVDLSVGSLLGLCGVVAGLSFPVLGVPATIILTLCIGLMGSLISGVLVASLGMSPIIVTLGGLTFFRGMAQWLSPDPLFGFPPAFAVFGYAKVMEIPYLTIVMVAVLASGLLFMRFMPSGRHAVAIGVNERAAFLVGLPVSWTVILLYVMVGLATALAALMTIARINSAPSGTLGVGMELNVLTAVLLGGVPFAGGRASLWRVALGVLLLGMLSNGLILMNARTEISLMITGLVLVIAAGLNVLKTRFL